MAIKQLGVLLVLNLKFKFRCAVAKRSSAKLTNEAWLSLFEAVAIPAARAVTILPLATARLVTCVHVEVPCRESV
jgi:hypothetical protein